MEFRDFMSSRGVGVAEYFGKVYSQDVVDGRLSWNGFSGISLSWREEFGWSRVAYD